MENMITRKEALDHIVKQTGLSSINANKKLYYMAKHNPSLELVYGGKQGNVVTHLSPNFFEIEIKKDRLRSVKKGAGRPKRSKTTKPTVEKKKHVACEVNNEAMVILKRIASKSGVSLNDIITCTACRYINEKINELELDLLLNERESV